MSNSEYLRKFKSLVDVFIHLGGEPGITEGRVNDHIAETGTGMQDARAAVQEEYLAVRFLFRSDKRRYGSLLAELENDFTRGINAYPSTISGAYDMLVNYRNPHPHGRMHYQESGVAFYQEDGADTERGGRGRGRGGRGRGRGGRGRGYG